MHHFFFFWDNWVCAVSYRAAACCLKAMQRDPLKYFNNTTIMAPSCICSQHTEQDAAVHVVLYRCVRWEKTKKGTFRFYLPAV